MSIGEGGYYAVAFTMVALEQTACGGEFVRKIFVDSGGDVISL